MNMTVKAHEEGETHLNVYSGSSHWVGRALSNFYRAWVSTEEGAFQSIEAYWYFLKIKTVIRVASAQGWVATFDLGLELDELRNYWGFEAKKRGRALLAKLPLVEGVDFEDEVFRSKILGAVHSKVGQVPGLREALIATHPLPLLHYYSYGVDPRNKRCVFPKGDTWFIDGINAYRDLLVQQELGLGRK